LDESDDEDLDSMLDEEQVAEIQKAKQSEKEKAKEIMS